MADNKITERQESCQLIKWLKRMVGDDVDISVIGNWIFRGRLSRVEDNLAYLNGVTIFPPGDLCNTIPIGSLVVNLEVVTFVGQQP